MIMSSLVVKFYYSFFADLFDNETTLQPWWSVTESKLYRKYFPRRFRISGKRPLDSEDFLALLF